MALSPGKEISEQFARGTIRSLHRQRERLSLVAPFKEKSKLCLDFAASAPFGSQSPAFGRPALLCKVGAMDQAPSILEFIAAAIARSPIVVAQPAERLPDGFDDVDVAILEWIAAEGRRIGRGVVLI